MSNAPNFPPTNPITRPNQIQKGLFPFDSYSADDPNVTAIPGLTLKSPWVRKGTFSGVGTALTNAIADTAANLASSNPVLLKGQIGYETDTKFYKIGDGAAAYNSLSYQPQYGKVAPLPQLPAGVGQITLTFGTVGASVNAPAGGMWQYTALIHATLNGSYLGGSGNTFFGICAGGSQAVAGQAGAYFDVFFWRIA